MGFTWDDNDPPHRQKRRTGAAEESQASQLRDQAEQLQAGAQSMEHQVEARHGSWVQGLIVS